LTDMPQESFRYFTSCTDGGNFNAQKENQTKHGRLGLNSKAIGRKIAIPRFYGLAVWDKHISRD
jgi:hypothetical protein